MIRLAASVLAVTMLIAGCASFETQRWLDGLRDRLDQFANAEWYFEINLLSREGLSADQVEQRETAIMKQAEAVCFGPIIARLDRLGADASAQAAQGHDAAIHDLPNAAQRADADLTECLRPFGVSGAIGKTVAGQDMGMVEFIQRGIAAAMMYRRALVQAQRERDLQWTTLAYAFSGSSSRPNAFVNPSQTYVLPYTTTDGKVVRGHWRTNPNATCIDNIGGCR